MVEWEVQETVVLCVTKYSVRNGGVVGQNGGKVEVDDLPSADWLVGWPSWSRVKGVAWRIGDDAS